MDTVKPIPCICGHRGVCVCQVPTTDWWLVHCQECGWHYGGSSLDTDKNKTILAWNTRPYTKKER